MWRDYQNQKIHRSLNIINKVFKICFIDTPEAFPGVSAEKNGQAEAIARNLYEMVNFTVPIISIIIGEGGSGGALALGIANYVGKCHLFCCFSRNLRKYFI